MEDIPHSLHKNNFLFKTASFLASTDVFTLHLHHLLSSASMIIQKCHEDMQPDDPKVREKLFIPKKGTL